MSCMRSMIRYMGESQREKVIKGNKIRQMGFGMA